MTKDLNNHQFSKKWVKHYTNILERSNPEIPRKEIKKYLQGVINEKMINTPATIHNNYRHEEINVSLLDVIDWYNDTNPIGGGFGVFFKNQHEVANPAAVMLGNFLTLRKTYKKQLHVHDENSYEYATFDRMQLTEKINANSYYGASGATSSNFFNIYTATSVTATGQSLISTTEQAFEQFLSNSVLFNDLDDCFVFLENVRKEKYVMDDSFLPNVSVELLIEHLSKTFYEYKEEYEAILFDYLINIPQRKLNHMYFKNNIYEFSYLPKIRAKLDRALMKTKEFKDPNDLPKSSRNEIEDLWDYYKEFVLYRYFTFNRIQRLKNDKRKTVVVVDTDSNMLNLNPWMIFMHNNVISVNDNLIDRDKDELRFICINLMCYFLTNMVTEILQKYTKDANIPKEFRDKINMKNEFLFTRLILSDKKKRYISSIRLREGKEIYPEKIDIKGIDFMKSSTREETKAYFTNLIKEKMLYEDDIHISEILGELERFEGIIRDSLQRGEKSFLIPNSVKEPGAYDDPFRQQGFRSVLAWNYLYPGNTIELPEKIDMIKMKMERPEDIADLEHEQPEFYERLMKNVFNNPNEKISKKGVVVIAIPRNVEAIPEWLMKYIDYDTIVNDNMSRFYSVLESLGVETIKASKKEYFANILRV